jgi:glutamate synthase (NADPH) small chain
MVDESKPKKTINYTRTKMKEQDPKVRITNYNEVPFGYTPEQAMEEASRCIKCKNRPCVGGCPVNIQIPEFLAHIAEGNFRESIRTIKQDNLLPAVCGRVCPQTEQCEMVCVLAKKGDAVGIGNLERFAADWERANGVEVPAVAKPTKKKVAVIGSGPGGLTVAADCAKAGHDVTIFEAFHKNGGVLIYGIPEFRLPKAIMKAEIDGLAAMGVKFQNNTVVGRSISMYEIMEEFDTAFIGLGAGLPWFLGIPGESLIGVYSANEYLTRSNLMKAYEYPKYDTPIRKGRRIATIGGGNVAMDSARTALRLGAEKSYIIYRRGMEEMPARVEEIHHAEQEGVDFQILRAPVRVIGDENGEVKGMELMKMELGEPDSSGRRRPVPIPGSEYILEVDLVIPAIGNGANPLLLKETPEIKTNKWGYIETDPFTCATSMKGVFSGGDIVRGGATVILAMGDGRRAAKYMDRFIANKNEWPPAPDPDDKTLR